MKFGKRLKRQIEESLPEWRDKFLSYKALKKLVRQISEAQSPSKAEAEFINLLNAEIDKFNAFFVEQEEEFIILQLELRERIKRVVECYGSAAESEQSAAEYAAEMRKIRKDIVNLHGEMVLLENYSSINYTGLAKILKKYDKRTGGLLRMLFIEKVLKQPFFMTDLVSKMVKECENTMEAMFPVVTPEQPEQVIGKALLVPEQSILRNTVAALLTMQELRKGSSTYGYFSLPPLNLPDADIPQPFHLPSPITIL